MTENHDIYIRRCFELAHRSTKTLKTNPPVGAVLVYQDRIIGEGYHQAYGQSHAEVNAVNSVKKEDQDLIPHSSLYVSLEPCCFHGKTPACTGLIQSKGIQKVIISAMDPNPKVSGKGIALLEAAGVSCITGVLEEAGNRLIGGFRAQLSGRPIISLKWAKSKYNYMGKPDEQLWLSNEYSRVLAHKLRSEHDGILIGTNTAIIDQPSLTTRAYPGEDPLRIVIDKSRRIPISSSLFNDGNPTLLISQHNEPGISELIQVLKLDFESEDFISQLLKELFNLGIYRLLVEGGSKVLRSFVKSGYWDYAYVINTQNPLNEGLKAPNIQGILTREWTLEADKIHKIANPTCKRLSVDC